MRAARVCRRNNLPYREFDGEEETKSSNEKSSSAQSRDSRKSRTLGLRLDINPKAEVNSIWGITVQMLSHGVMGSGETQVLDRDVAQCVVLDTRGLSMLDFTPGKVPRLAAIKRARRTTVRYFDGPDAQIDPDDQDELDDRQTRDLKYQAEQC
jgi:hypothetical protein